MKRTRGVAMPLVRSLFQMETGLLACKQNTRALKRFAFHTDQCPVSRDPINTIFSLQTTSPSGGGRRLGM